MNEESNLPPVTFPSIPVVSSGIQTSSNLVLSTASSGLLSAAASSLASPAVRTIRLLSPSAASHPIPLPSAVLAPTTSPFTLCRAATSTAPNPNNQYSSPAVSFSGFAPRFPVVNPSAGQNVQSPPARRRCHKFSPELFQQLVQARVLLRFQVRHLVFRHCSIPGLFTPAVLPPSSCPRRVSPRSSATLAVYVFARVSSIFGWPGHSSSIEQTCFRRGLGPICRVTGSR